MSDDFLKEMTIEHDALQLAEAGRAMREVLQTLSTPASVAAREWWDVVYEDHSRRVEAVSAGSDGEDR